MSSEMYDLLVEGAQTLTLHEKAQLATRLSLHVTKARYDNRSGKFAAFLWGCPKCEQTSGLKADMVQHLERDHKTRSEVAAWMPVPISEVEFKG